MKEVEGMALFELKQHYENKEDPWEPPTFKECAAMEIDATFFDQSEHAEEYKVDGRTMLCIREETDLRKHSAHWEAGAKQNFDTGLYTAHTILYIKAKDYGPKPKVKKELVLEHQKEGWKRTYSIVKCGEEDGIYRMTLERTRQ